MLNENIKALRKSKGLSQEELSVKLNVVRQTVSKWEQGLSVPDADMLISLSEALDTPVSTLLGDSIPEQKADEIKAISEKLEVINLRLSQRKESRRKFIRAVLFTMCALIASGFVALFLLKSPYLRWDFGAPETAVIGTAFHAAEYIFVRAAPVAFAACAIGIALTRKKV